MRIEGRVALVRREGNKVYLRSAEKGEIPDPVRINAGEIPIFESGDLQISTNDVDAYIKEDLGGYKMLAPLLHFFPLPEPKDRKRMYLAIGTRMDTSFVMCKNFVTEVKKLESTTDENERDFVYHQAVVFGEQAVTTLHRLCALLKAYNDKFGGIRIPDILRESVEKSIDRNTTCALRMLRNKIEHVEKNALKGKTCVMPAKRDDEITYLVAFIPINESGDVIGFDIYHAVNLFSELRSSVIDSMGDVSFQAKAKN